MRQEYHEHWLHIQSRIRRALRALLIGITSSGTVFAAYPSSTNYRLDSYGIGSGGSSVSNSSGANYSLNGISGEASGLGSSTNYQGQAGLSYEQQAATPSPPTLTNPGSSSTQLLVTLASSSAPSDTTYAVLISTDSFTTTNYVWSDGTVHAAYSSTDFRTYAGWGSSSGSSIVGLSASTTYAVKIVAAHGLLSQSEASSSVSTSTASGASLTFDIDTASTNIETSPPYTAPVGTLLSGTVTTAPNLLWFDIDTNATGGASIVIRDTSNGLTSATTGTTITSASADLSVASEGFGLQSASATQSAGASLVAQSPFAGASAVVGAVSTSFSEIYRATGPITAGRSSMYVKAKSGATTPAAADYADTLTIVALGQF